MLSPLRYPGGKAKLFPFFVELIRENDLYGSIYAEPYAGGAGLALKLLAHGYVQRVELNDIDQAIASFWRSVLQTPDEFCSLIASTDISVGEWRRQKTIYAQGIQAGDLALGFSAYYLNRTSRSGIIEGSGPIGGYSQQGPWTIDARFNRKTQISQIQDIARFSPNISIYSEDAISFSKERLNASEYFTYLDPPYYVKGKKLYKNFYDHGDHLEIANMLREGRSSKWVLSYDYVEQIVSMYPEFEPTIYSLQYSAGTIGKGQEVVFAGDAIRLPAFPGFNLAA